MNIFAIDPGTTDSAFVLYNTNDNEVLDKGKENNNILLSRVHENNDIMMCDAFVVEMIASYGMPVGAEVFETKDGSIAFTHLKKAVKDESVRLIGIDEELYKSMNPRFLEAIKKRGKPLILSMQSVSEGGISTDEYIRMMTLSTAGVIVKVDKD